MRRRRGNRGSSRPPTSRGGTSTSRPSWSTLAGSPSPAAPSASRTTTPTTPPSSRYENGSIINYRVTNLDGKNLPLTEFRWSWKLVCHHCTYLLSRQDGETFQILGISKRLFPGCVKSGEIVAFCLPTAGRKIQFFHHKLSQPGKSLLGIPCRGKAGRERSDQAGPG